MPVWNYQGKSEFTVAVVGATGLVGKAMLETLERLNFPVKKLKAVASARSAGEILDFHESAVVVTKLEDETFEGVDFALFSAGSEPSKKYAPIAAKAGCVVIDNSSAWRMDKEVPLVVPEVNPGAAFEHNGIIANPNCSTIIMVTALKPLHDAANIKRIVVSTYQSVSGKGWKAMDELHKQAIGMLNGIDYDPKEFPHRIAFNCLPHIDVFLPSGSSKEEKMVKETQKIMDPKVKVSATTVRVPVFVGHSESVNLEFERPLSPEDARALLEKAPGVIVEDDLSKALYPLASRAAGEDEVFVGRIRKDPSLENGLNMWIVGDNLLKGAALNAVQIAQLLVKGS